MYIVGDFCADIGYCWRIRPCLAVYNFGSIPCFHQNTYIISNVRQSIFGLKVETGRHQRKRLMCCSNIPRILEFEGKSKKTQFQMFDNVRVLKDNTVFAAKTSGL